MIIENEHLMSDEIQHMMQMNEHSFRQNTRVIQKRGYTIITGVGFQYGLFLKPIDLVDLRDVAFSTIFDCSISNVIGCEFANVSILNAKIEISASYILENTTIYNSSINFMYMPYRIVNYGKGVVVFDF